jgi:prevent-host-death family protein
MLTMGAFEAKTHLSALLERVARGEEVVITKRGRPFARPVPAAPPDPERISRAMERIKAIRKGPSLGGPSWKDQRGRDAARRRAGAGVTRGAAEGGR